MKAVGREVVLAQGIWQERRLEPAGRRTSGRLRAAKGELYVFAHAEGVGAEALELQVCRRIAETYYQDGARSVTTSLTRALDAANRDLWDASEQAGIDDQRCAVMCLVLREGDVYLAQVGAALAYLVVPEGVQLIGRTAQAHAALLAGLGSAAKPDAELFYRTIDQTCSVVLGPALLAEVAPPTALRQLLVLSDDLDVGVALQALIRAGGRGAELRALIVDVERPTCRPSPARRAPAPPAPSEPAPEAPDPEAPDEPAAEEVTPEEEAERRSRARLGDRVVRRLDAARSGVRRATSTTPRLLRTLLVVAMATLAIFAAVVVPLRLWQDRQAGIADLDILARAEQKEREALSAEDAGERLRLLLEANELAARAERAVRLRREDAAGAQALVRRTQKEVDALSGAVRLGQPTRLLAVEGQPAQVVLGGADLYVLDRAVDRVYRYALAPDGQGIQAAASGVVFRKGDRFGDAVAGGPRRLLWMPAGGRRVADALLVFDEDGALFEVDRARGARALRSPSPWKLTEAFAGYAGSLFVLDPLAGTLEWRPPGPDGYDWAAYPYLQPEVSASLADCTALAVDGDLYLLHKNGRIDRFATGQPQPFAGGVPDRPLAAPASILATPRSVYVLDRPNRRLVHFDREGVFQRQYLFDGRDDLVEVAVDEARGLLYYLGKQGLYLYRIERPG